MPTTDAPTQLSNEIDVSNYRTPELAAAIIDLINTPKEIKGLLGTCLIFVLLVPLAIYFGILWLNPDANTAQRWSATLYAIPASGIATFAFWIAEFIRRSFNKILTVVNYILETTKKIAADYRKVVAGNAKLPPTKQLVNDVYEKLIKKILREAVDEVFGFVGKPIYWVYQATVDRVLKIAIRRAIKDKLPLTADTQARPQNAATESIEQVNKQETEITNKLETARQYIISGGGWLKTMVMIPCYAIAGAITVLLVMPLLCLIFW